MSIKAKHIVAFLLFIILFSGLRGGRYFFENKIQEVGLLFCIILFIYSSYTAAIQNRQNNIKWTLWFFGPLAFITYIIFVPGLLYGYYNKLTPLPSILALREYIFFLLLPTLYFLYKSGYNYIYFERLFIVTIIFLVSMYLVLSNTLPLKEWYFSTDRYKATMVANDGWRGLRLHAPVTALQIGFFLSYFKTFHGNKNRIYWLFMFLISCMALLTYNSRSIIVILPVCLLFYYIFFRSNEHYPFFVIMVPVIICILAFMGISFFDELKQQFLNGDDTRLPMYVLAIDLIRDKPLFGMGMSSFFSKTDAELLNTPFFPVDIGLVGIAYRYGLVGAVLYVVGVIVLFYTSIKTHFKYRNIGIKTDILIIVFICRMIGDVFRYILSVDFTNGHGLVLASIIIVFNIIKMDELDVHYRNRNII